MKRLGDIHVKKINPLKGFFLYLKNIVTENLGWIFCELAFRICDEDNKFKCFIANHSYKIGTRFYSFYSNVIRVPHHYPCRMYKGRHYYHRNDDLLTKEEIKLIYGKYKKKGSWYLQESVDLEKWWTKMCILKMFSIVGKKGYTYKRILELSYEWYEKMHISQGQWNEWKEWCIALGEKNQIAHDRESLDKKFAFIDLNYGFKIV